MKKLLVILFILLSASFAHGKDIEASRAQLKIETKTKIEAQRAGMLERKKQHKVEMEVEVQKIINLYRSSQRRSAIYSRNYYRQRRVYPVRRYRNRNRTIIIYSGRR